MNNHLQNSSLAALCISRLKPKGNVALKPVFVVCCVTKLCFLRMSRDRFVLQVFEELLLDADWSVNAGSWMWLSCSSFFQQFFHCYCPVGFGRRTDPNGDFIRWVPTWHRPLVPTADPPYLDGTLLPLSLWTTHACLFKLKRCLQTFFF